jgi:hypothetical protein
VAGVGEAVVGVDGAGGAAAGAEEDGADCWVAMEEAMVVMEEAMEVMVDMEAGGNITLPKSDSHIINCGGVFYMSLVTMSLFLTHFPL